MAYKSDPKIFDDVYRLYQDGQFQEAYDLLTDAARHYPDEGKRIYEWRFDLAARLGKPELSESIFQEALDSGFFYGDRTLRTDEDLKDMQGRPVFEALVRRDLEILAEAQKHATPELEILYHGKESINEKPLFMALHGNNSNVEKLRQYWGALWNTEYLVALPQSSQLSGKGIYVWNDMQIVEQELRGHYSEIKEKYLIDPTKTIISGFSKGGHVAVDAAVKGYLPAKGFLAVAPYIGNPEELAPHFDVIQNKHLRGFIIAGGKDDECISSATWLHDEMKAHGLRCEIKVYPEMGHDFPDDFDTILPEIIQFLSGG